MPASLHALFLSRLKAIGRAPDASPQAGSNLPVAASAAQLATAALLIEVSRADHRITDSERSGIEAHLRDKFRFSEVELQTLLSTADAKVEASTSLHEFTHLINQHLDRPSRAEIVTALWRIAFADGHIDKHEEFLVRKIADLLHVPHRAFIQGKLLVTGKKETVKP